MTDAPKSSLDGDAGLGGSGGLPSVELPVPGLGVGAVVEEAL